MVGAMLSDTRPVTCLRGALLFDCSNAASISVFIVVVLVVFDFVPKSGKTVVEIND